MLPNYFITFDIQTDWIYSRLWNMRIRCCNANHPIHFILHIFKNDFYFFILHIQEIKDTNIVEFYEIYIFISPFCGQFLRKPMKLDFRSV
jgi:hypothetical protein